MVLSSPRTGWDACRLTWMSCFLSEASLLERSWEGWVLALRGVGAVVPLLYGPEPWAVGQWSEMARYVRVLGPGAAGLTRNPGVFCVCGNRQSHPTSSASVEAGHADIPVCPPGDTALLVRSRFLASPRFLWSNVF